MEGLGSVKRRGGFQAIYAPLRGRLTEHLQPAGEIWLQMKSRRPKRSPNIRRALVAGEGDILQKGANGHQPAAFLNPEL